MRCQNCKRHVGPRNLTATGKCIFCAPPDEWKPEWTARAVSFGTGTPVLLHGRERILRRDEVEE